MKNLSSEPQSIGQDLRTESSVQLMPLGSRATLNNGSVYRYVKVGVSALVAGNLLDGPASVANHTNIAVQAAAAIGATSVSVTLGATATVANDYAGGVMIVNDVTGEGHTYQIKSHPAHAGSGTLVITLDEPVLVALTTSSEVTLIASQYNGVVIHPVTEIGTPVGASIAANTAAYFCWIQTRGPVACLHDASPAGIGLVACASTTTAGCITSGVATLAAVGAMLAAGVSTEFNPVFLQLE